MTYLLRLLLMKKDELSLLEHHNQLVDAIARDESIPRGVKNFLVGLATFFNVTNQCAFPNRRQIAKRTGYCSNHITALIKESKKLGLIKSTAQFFHIQGEDSPRQVANKYEFVLDKFGLYYNKTKALLNRNLRKKNKQQQKPEHTNTKPIHAPVIEKPHTETSYDYDYLEEYAPPN